MPDGYRYYKYNTITGSLYGNTMHYTSSHSYDNDTHASSTLQQLNELNEPLLTNTLNEHTTKVHAATPANGNLPKLAPTATKQHFHSQCIFLLLGIGLMVPWNAIVVNTPYFESKLCTDDDFIQANFEAIFAFVFNMANVLALVLLLRHQYRYHADNGLEAWMMSSSDYGISDDVSNSSSDGNSTISTTYDDTYCRAFIRDFGHKIQDFVRKFRFYIFPNNSDHDWNQLITPSLIVYTTMLLIATGMGMRTSDDSKYFFVWTVVLIAVCGFACSVASAGIFAMAERFSNDECNDQSTKTLFLAGQSAAGFLVAVLNLVAVKSQATDSNDDCTSSAASSDNNNSHLCTIYSSIDWSAEYIFIGTSVILLVCIFAFRTLNNMYNSDIKKYQKNDDLDESSSSKASKATEASSTTILPLLEGCALSDNVNTHAQEQSILSQMELDAESFVQWEDIVIQNETYRFMELLKRTKWPVFTVFFNYIVTLGVYPAWTSKLESTEYCLSSYRIRNDLFQPMLLLVFNLFDLVGKFAAGYFIQYVVSGKSLMYTSLARLLLVPAFLFCNASESNLNVIFAHDVWPITFMALLGLSNGCVSSMGMMHGPSLVQSSKDKENCSTMMVLVLSIGLLAGSICSFLVLRIGTGSW